MTTDCAACPLRRLGVFDDLSRDEVAFLQRFKHGELRVEPGTPLLMEGSNSPQMYTALHGLGLRTKTLADGRRQVVNFVFPGDFLGLQAGVMGKMRHSVEATTQMTLCVFDRSEIWNLFRQSPERAFDITWHAAMEEHFLGEALTSIGQMSGLERMAWGLQRYARRCSMLALNDGRSYPFPFRQQDLADALGLSLVHTNKTLQKLRERQLVALRSGRLSLPDPEGLAALTGGAPETERRRPLI